MPTRERNRYLWYPPGFRTRTIGSNPPVTIHSTPVSPVQAKWWGRCRDTYGEPNIDHPLEITERDSRGLPLLNGIRVVPGDVVEYKDYYPSGFDLVSHIGISIPSISSRAITLRARTNPSREEVSIPNFVHELKDFPRMIKQIQSLPTLARNFKHRHSAAFREAASQHLGFEFGWKPLINDLRDILSFQDQVDKRIVELNRLYSEKGLKRRLSLFDSSAVDVSNVNVDTGGGITITARKTRVTRVRSWGTIRWRPTAVPKDLRRQDLGQVARKLVFGLQHRGIDGLQAWNALPFSWLADWFSNYGEWLAANRNVIPAAPSGPCNIMTLSETYVTWQRTDNHKVITGAEGVRILRTKERAQSSGSLSVHLPLATARQLGILLALNLQRRTR